MMDFCFFFFKQKTAYEMRISDWSSDVCSSDLFATYKGKGRSQTGKKIGRLGMLENKSRTEIGQLGEFGLIDHLTKNIRLHQKSTEKGVGEIGRASCRERVCQYG